MPGTGRNRINLFAGLLPGRQARKETVCHIGFAGWSPLSRPVAEAYKQISPHVKLVLYHPAPDFSPGEPAKSLFQEIISDEAQFLDLVDALEVFDFPGGNVSLVGRMLGNGKYVSVQKPVARSSEEALELIETASKSKKRFRISDYSLYYEPYCKLKQLIDNMEIGEVCAARFRSNLAGKGGVGPVPEWLRRASLFHPAFDRFGLAIELLGDVSSVSAYMNPMRARKGGQAIASFKCKAPGRYGFLDLTYAPGTSIRTAGFPCDDQVEIAGTDGIIWANHFHGKMTEEPWIEVRRGKKHYTLGIGSGMALDWEHSILRAAEDFVQCMIMDEPARPGFRKARKTLRFMAAAIDAADRNEKVNV